MKAKHCDECKHFAPYRPIGSTEKVVCWRGHRPRFYTPKGAGDTDYGYKRKCDDYKKDEAK